MDYMKLANPNHRDVIRCIHHELFCSAKSKKERRECNIVNGKKGEEKDTAKVKCPITGLNC